MALYCCCYLENEISVACFSFYSIFPQEWLNSTSFCRLFSRELGDCSLWSLCHCYRHCDYVQLLLLQFHCLFDLKKGFVLYNDTSINQEKFSDGNWWLYSRFRDWNKRKTLKSCDLSDWWATGERLMSDWWATDEWLMSDWWATDERLISDW